MLDSSILYKQRFSSTRAHAWRLPWSPGDRLLHLTDVSVVLQVFRSFANQQYGHALVFHDYQVGRHCSCSSSTSSMAACKYRMAADYRRCRLLASMTSHAPFHTWLQPPLCDGRWSEDLPCFIGFSFSVQAKRGGHVQLGPINPPQMDYKHEKGDALYSMELTVGFEKVRQQQYRSLPTSQPESMRSLAAALTAYPDRGLQADPEAARVVARC